MRKSIKLILLGLSMLTIGTLSVVSVSQPIKEAEIVLAEGEEVEQPQEEQPVVVEEPQPVVQEGSKESESKPSQIATDFAHFMNTPLGYTIVGVIGALIVFGVIFSKTKVGKKVVKLLYAKIEEEKLKRQELEKLLKEQEESFKEFEEEYIKKFDTLCDSVILIASKSRDPKIKKLASELESEK